jgi:hypothetical protein
MNHDLAIILLVLATIAGPLGVFVLGMLSSDDPRPKG